MEVKFVELPDKGVFINLATIATFEPKRSNRIDYVDGRHGQLSDSDAKVLIDALKPKPRGRPKKENGVPDVPDIPKTTRRARRQPK